MSELLFFILGYIIGGLGGIVIMCLLQISSYKKQDVEIVDELCEKEM